MMLKKFNDTGYNAFNFSQFSIRGMNSWNV